MTTPSITVAQLGPRLRSGSHVLVEALSADFHDAGHLPGAVSAPLSSSDDEIVELIARSRGATIVVYGSRDGGEAIELAQRLVVLGHRDVLVLEGGKEAWVEAGHVLDRRPGR